MVAHLSFSGKYYGRESAAFSLVKALQSKIDVIMFLVVENRNGSENNRLLVDKMKEFNIKYEIIYTDETFSIATLKKLRSLMDRHGVKLTHCHCFKSVVYSLLIRLIHHKAYKIVFTLHGLILPFNVKSIIFKTINLLSVALADGVIGCTHKYLPAITKLPGLRGKTTVIVNAYESDKQSGCTRSEARRLLDNSSGKLGDKLVVAFIGRFTEVKNPLFFLDIVRETCTRYPEADLPAHFVMIGDGELRPDLESQIACNHLDGHITLPGYISEMHWVYPGIDILLMTSNIEGIPMCILESMSHSIPVVAPEVGGIPEIIRHGVTGLLFPRRSLQESTNHLLSLLESSELRSRLGGNGFKEVKSTFCYEKSIQSHLQFYRKILPDHIRLA